MRGPASRALDEAAAIPLPVVKSLLGPYLVFLSSTVNGYEGTGRSLSLKLVSHLEKQSHNPATGVISGNSEGPERIRELIAMGASFDHGDDGNLHLAREGWPLSSQNFTIDLLTSQLKLFPQRLHLDQIMERSLGGSTKLNVLVEVQGWEIIAQHGDLYFWSVLGT
ncbi:uncharacterized protein [Spinacia oleracea]|uniref:Uncharacterized protein isoform X1 n=1 Tax=Spinacia oleracea TaxID=3562 RepID=A0ABM3QJM4_SPIOL|nr:uncharacterized protein LOC110787974 isoform X1 [Spinacia oleracea]